MNKAIYNVIVLALVLMLSACNDGTVNSTDSALNTTSDTITENLIKKETQVRNGKTIITEPAKDEPIYIGDKEAIEKAKAIPLNEWEGPFQVAASSTVNYEDIQHYIDYVSGLASAFYWVDFLSYEATAILPAESVAYVEEPIPVGWRNIANRIPGIRTSHFYGNGFTTLTIETHSVYIKYNVAGQSIDIEHPPGLIDGFNYTYYYIEQP